MDELRCRNPSLHNRTQSANSIRTPTHSEASMLFSILPTAVQARIPKLPSLRRSVSIYGLAAMRKFPESGMNSGSRIPDLGYTSTMVLSRAGGVSQEEEISSYFGGSDSLEDGGFQIGSPLATESKRGMEVGESSTGISWKYANQGLNLLGHAISESSSIPQEAGNASFARQLYIHALTYLLRALPSDMTMTEKLSVRSALPPGVFEPMSINGDGELANNRPNSVKIPPRSLLHRMLATSILQLFIFFQLVLPYVKTFLQTAYRYEREHKISEKVLTQSITTVDQIGKRGLSVTGAIYGMGDGKVGQAITETASWVFEGVTGGIHEGVGEGMTMMGVCRPSALERE
ncbi:hypothetical protein BJ875DRAFT_419440 [Amylocarpus encephaloides]|uniref:Uncharacterized protein n=1 Tax=Amylocarpus encephaloides TaxID=45428 RepID=A0A9P7YNH1_9HELO|nr:hypothetical protein BJ875DRAFT_419440 [Amylocarpus encephaloides]